MAQKRNVAAALARQVAARTNVVELVQSLHAGAYRNQSSLVNKGPDPFLLFFPIAGEQLQVVNLHFLTSLTNLAEPLLIGFSNWATDKAVGTRKVSKVILQLGFCAYLHAAGATDISLSDLSQVHLHGFVKWLSRSAESGGRPWTVAYREDLLNGLRKMLNALKSDARYGYDASRLLDQFPVRSFLGSGKKSKPTERLSLDQLRQVLEAAETEIRSIVLMLAEGEKLLVDGILESEANLGTVQYRSKAFVLARLASIPGLPSLKSVEAFDSKLFHAISRNGGIKSFTKYLFPTPRHLIPFVLLIAISTAFNADTVRSLTWNNISFENVFGSMMVRLIGTKGRSGVQVLPISSESTNGIGLGIALDTLRGWTSRLSPLMPPSTGDFIFLWVPSRGPPAASTYTNPEGINHPVNWMSNLNHFCSDHGIDKFSLRQIRPTILDELQQQSGDILLAQQLGRHRDPSTTWSHYTSDGTKKRYKEALGKVFMLRERWIITNGVIDPQDRTGSQDEGAATPGFLCLDPFDSPQPNQRQGRLCTAYGRCPSCPLAAANISDRVSVAYYQALRRAIVSSRSQMNPQVYISQWAVVLADHDSLLSQVPAEVQEQAAKIVFNLPQVG